MKASESASRPEADIPKLPRHVRFGPEADFAARKARHFSGYAGIQKAQPHGMSAVAKFLIHLNFDPVPSE